MDPSSADSPVRTAALMGLCALAVLASVAVALLMFFAAVKAGETTPGNHSGIFWSWAESPATIFNLTLCLAFVAPFANLFGVVVGAARRNWRGLIWATALFTLPSAIYIAGLLLTF